MKTLWKVGIMIAGYFFLCQDIGLAATYQIPIEVSLSVDKTLSDGTAVAYNRLVLGIHREATEGYDPLWDTPVFFTLPDTQDGEAPQPVKAYFEHPEYSSAYRQLWRDIRSDAEERGGEKRWDLTIALSPSEVGKSVTVTWALPSSLMASKDRVTLSDRDSNSLVDMRASSSYSFISHTSSPKALSITISPSSGASDKSSSGAFGCGMVTPPKNSTHHQRTPDPNMNLINLVNLLILFSPLIFPRIFPLLFPSIRRFVLPNPKGVKKEN